MTVKEFMEAHIDEVIPLLPRPHFSSRDFIWEAMKIAERDYIEVLYNCNAEKPIQSVHAQIGKFLAEHADSYNISKLEEKEPNNSPFGTPSETHKWELVE